MSGMLWIWQSADARTERREVLMEMLNFEFCRKRQLIESCRVSHWDRLRATEKRLAMFLQSSQRANTLKDG